MKNSLTSIIVAALFTTSAAQAVEVVHQRTFRVREIMRIDDGNLGFKKLHYTLACDESAVQLLTESAAPHEIDVGMLVQSNGRPCDNPDRDALIRYLPGRNELRPVSHFDEVWYCSGWCYQQSTPGYPPTSRWVDAYGTSERQAYNNMSCGGWISGTRCDPVPIEE